MKIGIVCYPTLGGSGILATELGHQLASRGHQVHFITYEPPFRLRLDEKNLHFHAVDLTPYDVIRYPDYALALAVKMAEVSEQEGLDVLHVHYAIPHATSAFLAKQLLATPKPAVVTTLHGTDITLVGRDPAYKKIVKFSIENSDRVTTVSQDLRRQTQEDFGIQRDIDVIHNFFIPKKVDYEAREIRQQLTPKGEKLLIHASNFRPVKRVVDVIRILAQVRKKIDARLALVGTGIDIDAARHAIQALGLEDHVTFWGSKSSIDACIAAADVLLLPSRQESFGLVALEAMAYGVPVVATRTGGIPEVVEEGVTGLLAEVGDVDTMALHTAALLSDDDLHTEMAIEGRKRAQKHFGVDKILPQYEKLYKDVLQHHR